MNRFVPTAPLTCLGVSLRPLKPQHRLFVIFLMENGMDQTRAAKDAGYKQPNAKGSQLMKHPQIKRIVEKIQRKVGRETDLNIQTVLKKLAESLFRDLGDLVDENGELIADLRDLPDSVHGVIDGVKIRTVTDKDGKVHRQVEYKLSPNAPILDMALKVTGGYAPEKTEHALVIDWDQMLEPPPDADAIEQEIKNVESQFNGKPRFNNEEEDES